MAEPTSQYVVEVLRVIHGRLDHLEQQVSESALRLARINAQLEALLARRA